MNNGDVVKLRTGGPQMTVNRRLDSKGIGFFWECVWFSGAWDAQILNCAEFSESALLIVDAAPAAVAK